MVAIKGDNAHGFVCDKRSCSSVGSINCINLSAAPNPVGNFNLLSNILPNMISFALLGVKNLPDTWMLHVTPCLSSRLK